MNLLPSNARNEQGVALPMALLGLVMLTGFLVTFMSMAGMEPDIAMNLTSTAQARYLADAGIEFAFDQLAGSTDWDNELGNNNGQLASKQPLPGLRLTSGTFSVTLRNDNQPGDDRLTGRPLDPGNNGDDQNRIVIVTASGTVQGVTREIQVVVSRILIPPAPGAMSCPGVRCDFDTGTIDDMEGAHFHSDGRDRNRDDSWGKGPLKWAIAAPPGVDPSTGLPFEEGLESALNTHQKNEMDGVDQTKPGNPILRWNGEGQNTIAADPTLTPEAIADFIQQVKARPGVTIIQSSDDGTPIVVQDSKPVGRNKDLPINLGTVAHPKITYIKRGPDGGNNYPTVHFEGNTAGAGILIVEDGRLFIGGSFRWDGLVLVTGKDAGAWFTEGGQASLYGGLVVNETDPYGKNDELHIDRNYHGSMSRDQFTTFYSSEQNLTMVQNMPGLVRLSSWREM